MLFLSCARNAILDHGIERRLAFADAEELQKKVERLRARVKALEEGLRVLQADVSDDPHPLLLESESGAQPADRPSPSPANGAAPPLDAQEIVTPAISREEEEFIGAFGELRGSRASVLANSSRRHANTRPQRRVTILWRNGSPRGMSIRYDIPNARLKYWE